ncbi:hypothetical protein JGH11_10895 [Dysgonomonas sp. Marseille-P4677]|uniref:hypothetical protein n=1 Tax=Dysgonomonas sp. Marseille-P4677 TaxID=2364790 RepID=UPI001914382F|nr:hypothetical protein [Dysgonomonas sp. Marseille-P4677]MBK5721380.1 hypothetical protein [Dysgonomonas sp. Marseille-P4677]
MSEQVVYKKTNIEARPRSGRFYQTVSAYYKKTAESLEVATISQDNRSVTNNINENNIIE